MIVEKHPLFLVAGVFLLILPSLVFHITLFRWSRKFNHLLCSIVAGLYTAAAVDVLLGVFHYFHGGLLLGLSLFLSFTCAFYLKKRDIIIPDSHEPSFESVYIALGFVSLLIIYVYLTCFSKLPPDSMRAYLPWARIITNEHYIPATYMENNRYFFIGLPPLAYVQVASLFSLFNNFYMETGYSPSLFYAFLTIFLVMNWYRGKKPLVPLLSALMLGTNLLVFEVFAGILQEGPLLFYTSVSFYCLSRYLKENHTFYIVILAASCSLGALTKQSGMLLSLLFYLAIIIAVRSKIVFAQVTLFFFLTHLVVAAWLLRNFFLIGNPLFPYFNRYFESAYSSIIPGAQFRLSRLNIFSNLGEHAITNLRRYLINILSSLPLIILGGYNVVSRIKNKEQKIFTVMFVIFFIATLSMSRPNIRYILPLFGVLSVYVGEGLQKIVEVLGRVHLNISGFLTLVLSVVSKNKYIFLILLLFFDVLAIILFPCVMEGGEWDILEYLQEHEEPTDFYILGVASKTLIWYGGYSVFEPRDRSLRILIGDRIPFKENSEYYYELFSALNIKYVYDDPYGPINDKEYEEFNKIVKKIEKDEEHFQLVCESEGRRLWKVKGDV
jgi:hypothetical protein